MTKLSRRQCVAGLLPLLGGCVSPFSQEDRVQPIALTQFRPADIEGFDDSVEYDERADTEEEWIDTGPHLRFRGQTPHGAIHPSQWDRDDIWGPIDSVVRFTLWNTAESTLRIISGAAPPLGVLSVLEEPTGRELTLWSDRYHESPAIQTDIGTEEFEGTTLHDAHTIQTTRDVERTTEIRPDERLHMVYRLDLRYLHPDLYGPEQNSTEFGTPDWALSEGYRLETELEYELTGGDANTVSLSARMWPALLVPGSAPPEY